MIVNKQNKSYCIRPDKPSSNWALETGEYYLVNEATAAGKALAEKIISYTPDFEFVLDEDNQLTDIVSIRSQAQILAAVQIGRAHV